MKIGFTGSSKYITVGQKQTLREIIWDYPNMEPVITELHHGDCIVADSFAHNLAKSAKIRVIIHPPDNPIKRAWNMTGDEYRTELPYLDRNKNIVNETEMLIAMPNTNKEILRSGTWSTVRYARKKNKKIIIIYPNGEIGKENVGDDYLFK